ncbi:hypothetical protein [Paenibacillus radicis (ex Gao et al. 2016)]|uniref:Lipoprotein n=1 Tax=Paenibacillus radicis (ex Gao et al. 2016) TaxID=1737354 RepID=A0A917LVS9_9BACL|nr:hypothetical protein [Paenibacillus radicis (ex Gao et al. 2016)]GGG60934.1 hypothetical protein GCM10010918_12880 [Paenibacillus radicis (ex Gao et al. 2016)]
MRKRSFTLFILIVLALAGCSSGSRLIFEDEDIKIKLTAFQVKEDYTEYEIEVKNDGKVEVRNLNFYLSFPVITTSGTSENPFKLEGRTGRDRPVVLSPGEKTIYTFKAPIQKVFGDSKLLNFNQPFVDLNGTILYKKKEIPFSKGMGLGLVEDSDKESSSQ